MAKAYRLLKAIMNTAADDGLIRRNPCRIKGGGQEASPERSALTLAQVFALAEAVGLRYRALVLLGTFGSLRWGELAALRRKDLDLERRTITVERSLTELPGGGYLYGPPKSAAGRRQVSFPELIVADLRTHLASSTGPGDGAPRARVERATYCLGGTPAPALRTPAKTHLTSKRNSPRQLLPKRSSGCAWQSLPQLG